MKPQQEEPPAPPANAWPTEEGPPLASADATRKVAPLNRARRRVIKGVPAGTAARLRAKLEQRKQRRRGTRATGPAK